MGTHPIFESDFDCLTEIVICKFMSTKVVCILAVAVAVFCLILCFLFCVLKRKVETIVADRTLQNTELDGNPSSDLESSCLQSWCRFWCADDLTYDVELDLDSVDHNDEATTEGTELKSSKRTISSRSSHSGRAGRSNRSNSVISSIEVAVTNLKESPKLARNSTTVARRLSHDPFLLCNDLQKIEMRRKTQQKRRMSEQCILPYRPVDSNRSKTSLHNY